METKEYEYAIVPDTELTLADALRLIRAKLSLVERKGMHFVRSHNGNFSLAYVRTETPEKIEVLQEKVPELDFVEADALFTI